MHHELQRMRLLIFVSISFPKRICSMMSDATLLCIPRVFWTSLPLFTRRICSHLSAFRFHTNFMFWWGSVLLDFSSALGLRREVALHWLPFFQPISYNQEQKSEISGAWIISYQCFMIPSIDPTMQQWRGAYSVVQHSVLVQFSKHVGSLTRFLIQVMKRRS